MKLCYSTGASSLSPHIVLREAGLPFYLVLASTKTHKLADPTDYYGINPKGYVLQLRPDDKQRLSEGPAIGYLGNESSGFFHGPGRQPAGRAGSVEGRRLAEVKCRGSRRRT